MRSSTLAASVAFYRASALDRRLSHWLGQDLPSTILLDFPSIQDLALELDQRSGRSQNVSQKTSDAKTAKTASGYGKENGAAESKLAIDKELLLQALFFVECTQISLLRGSGYCFEIFLGQIIGCAKTNVREAPYKVRRGCCAFVEVCLVRRACWPFVEYIPRSALRSLTPKNFAEVRRGKLPPH